jgi:hypothetical protein
VSGGPVTPKPAPDYTRKEVNVAAARLAANIRRFMEDGDQFISLPRRFSLTSAALELEALADGR